MLAIGEVRNFDHPIGGSHVLNDLALALFQHPDDPAGNAVNQNRLANTVMRREEVLIDLGADDCYILAVQVFEVGEESTKRALLLLVQLSPAR